MGLATKRKRTTARDLTPRSAAAQVQGGGEQQTHEAEGGGLGGGVQPVVAVGHADDADGPHEKEEEPDHERDGGEDVEDGIHEETLGGAETGRGTPVSWQ